MFVSISEGFCLEGLLAAILLSAGEDMVEISVDIKGVCLLKPKFMTFTIYRVCQASNAKMILHGGFRGCLGNF